ncbi:MAG: ABC transporter ATP-binding protein, partial [Pseudomonadota bacterium]|nr:ABC transporter ATP-binding protein [Pseudomonadota bacterium]
MFSSDDKVIVRRFWRDWVLHYRSRLVLIFALMVLVAATGGAYPALIRHVFDVLAGGADQAASSTGLIRLDDPFVLIPLAIILLSSVKATAMYFQVLTVNSLALKITTDIQKAMADRLIDADLATVTSEPAGAFISRIMNDLNLVREAFVRLANNLVRDVLTIIVMVGVMFWFSWLLSVLVLAVYPLAIRPIIRIGNRQRKASGDLQEHMETVTSLLAEILQGVRMVKAYRLEAAEKSRSAAAFEGLYNRLVHLLAGRARIDPILEVLGGFAVAGVIGVAAWQVANGQMQVGDVAGFITALLMLVQPVRAIGTLNAVTQEGLAATSRVFGLLDQEVRITDPAKPKQLNAVRGTISFEGVSFAYQDAAILNNISFTIAPGQTVALVGPSGSGKSTIINLLPRFYDPTAGQIKIDGTPISQLSLSGLRSHIAL